MPTLEQIKTRVREIEITEQFDMVVAVANGGIIPAALINQRLDLPFETIRISFRDSSQQPLYAEPQLKSQIGFECNGKRILLVEDRVKSGASLSKAKELLQSAGATVKTMAVNGKSDYSLFDESCFKFPWIIY